MPINAAQLIFDNLDGDYSDLIEVKGKNLEISSRVTSLTS